MRKSQRLILVGLLFTLLFIFAGVNTYFSASDTFSSGFSGWYLGRDGRVLTTRFGSGNSSSALQEGDEIVLLNGRPFKNQFQYFELLRQTPAGHSYNVAISRNGREYYFTLQTIPRPRLLLVLKVLTEMRLLAFIWLLVGLVVFLLRPDNKQALLFALMFGSGAVGGNISPNLIMGDLPTVLLAILITVQGISMLSVPIIVHFFLFFPEPSPLLRKYTRLDYWIYLPWLLVATPLVLVRALLWTTAPARLVEISREFPLLTQSSNTLLLIYVASALGILLMNYRRATQTARRRIRVAVAGSLAGLLPFLGVKAITFYWGEFAINNLFTAVSIIADLMLVLFPLSFAYAIARHQVIPVSLIIRRTVQYLLAKNAFRGLLALPIIGVGLTIIGNRHQTLDQILLHNSIYFYGLLTVAIVLGLFYRKRVSDWLDRKFFRESYNQEKILRELIDEVQRLDSIPEMSRRVSQQVERALHPRQVYLFYRAEDRADLSLGYSSGGSHSELRLPQEFQLLNFLEKQAGVVDFPLPSKTELPQTETDWFRQLAVNLIVPIVSTENRISGVLLLGEKRSELPYTAGDRRLLQTVANQIAVSYENVRLRERVDRDRRIKQEVLARIEGSEFNLLKECPICGTCHDSSAEVCETDQVELTLSLPVERTIENRYRLEQLIGKGGMGAVYEATDLRLNRQVAVKILKASMFGDRAALRRFANEAQASARLSHRNIVTVHDYGALSTKGAFLVMEMARGETLRVKLSRERVLHPQVAADVFDQILEGLKAAHAVGVVHRDLKPENVLISDSVDNRLEVKILDFGLAKLTESIIGNSQSPTAVATSPGMVLGTFGYMSPEQLMGAAVDDRSDLFSLGIMVVEVLTGQRPFGGATYHEILNKILHQPFHLAGNSLAWQELDQVLQRCLAKSRITRFNSAAELQAQLIPALRECRSIVVHADIELEAETSIKTVD